MDPDQALTWLRDNAAKINQLNDRDYTDEERNTLLDEGRAMAETFAGLDAWLSKGGFLPKPWHR